MGHDHKFWLMWTMFFFYFIVQPKQGYDRKSILGSWHNMVIYLYWGIRWLVKSTVKYIFLRPFIIILIAVRLIKYKFKIYSFIEYQIENIDSIETNV